MTDVINSPSICRNCPAFCPVIVTVQDGRAIKVIGDPESELYEGYLCPKGRAMPEQHNDPGRLLHSHRREANGLLRRIDPRQAATEVAARLQKIIAEHGPRSVALYFGTGTQGHLFGPGMGSALLRALGSSMIFSAHTIDKPAEKICVALHGTWEAGMQSFETSDTLLIVGANPVIAKSNGAPFNNPGMRLKEMARSGKKLIVIDPRRTETAQRAHVHLQAKPGHDPAILAGIIRIIIAEGLHDPAFIAANAQGFDALREAVAPFNPQMVAERAGIPEGDLIEAARTFGRGPRGGVVCATGPSFSLHSNLTFYLALCLTTLCGRWTREGEIAPYQHVLLPAFAARAQPHGPTEVFGKSKLRVKDLTDSAAGMPTAALAEEILLAGEGQVKALIVVGGNPVSSWPDQLLTESAMKSLDLLVTLDVRMTATAKLAHYAIATPLPLEVPGSTFLVEGLKYSGVSRGYQRPWAQYTPATTEPPAGSDLIADHEFFFLMAQALGVQLNWINRFGLGKNLDIPLETIPLDMAHIPTHDEMIELTTRHSSIPLEEVKAHLHGAIFDRGIRVLPAEPGRPDRLELGDRMMFAELAEIAANTAADGQPSDLPLRLVSRRANNVCNSILTDLPSNMAREQSNPVFVHPDDLAGLGIAGGDLVEISSRSGRIRTIAEPDRTLRPGVIAMTHGYGTGQKGDDDLQTYGSNVNLLISVDEFDPISGIPRMSNIAVALSRVG